MLGADGTGVERLEPRRGRRGALVAAGPPWWPTAGARRGWWQPLVVDERVVGTLVAADDEPDAVLVRTTTEVAQWVSSQLELAELDASRARLAEAEVRALRAQISPHFIYNALTAIASYVRTDPEHARELLLEFADFTRYSFRRHGDFTTLAEELRSIDRYLTLERARFGDRLQVTVRVAPEVLPVAVPYLCLQPIVENAVRHGLEGKAGPGRITILAEDDGAECLITVEDDGIGADPEQIRLAMTGEGDSDSIGVGNVDERMRSRLRRRVRPRGRDWARPRHEGVDAGPQVLPRSPRMTQQGTSEVGMRVLAVDDEAPARAELAYLLERDPRIATVLTASDGAEALRMLETTQVDALFVDIRMPGLDGLDLARVLRRFAAPPAVVFVSAYDNHALEAFDLRAVDYLHEAGARGAPGRGGRPGGRRTDRARSSPSRSPRHRPRTTTRRSRSSSAASPGSCSRSEVRYVEAHGDYARLVTADGRHLVRVSLALLEEQWADAGFVRIHRRWLVPLRAIDEVRSDGGRMSVRVGDAVLSVSRRHTRELRDRLVRGARPGR